MASQLRMGTDYHKQFDPKKYLAMSCSPPAGSEEEKYFRDVHLKELHKVFDSDILSVGQHSLSTSYLTGVIKPRSRLLDVGTGPTIYQLISASRFCTEIVCAEYAEANRAEVQKWINGDPGAYDWTPSFQYVAELEGDSSSWRARQSHLRNIIKEVIPCDVTNPDPLTPNKYEQFDVITSMKCLELACSTRESYSAAVRSTPPGGTLVLISVISESFHTVGEHKFFTLHVDETFIEEVLKTAGYIGINIKMFSALLPKNNEGFWGACSCTC
ncbi:INMT [Branchiostoma lanceolatum]|uniref:INMT protein n=1 Tax=Branchiostoma lanceolatum TaxID=7740 RepID=A0A8J9Z361_BRALA|nr:INMT [Branchiostoma lanceolatum]